jgi:hypothetical protein
MIRRTTPRTVVADRRLPIEIGCVVMAKIVLLTVLWALFFRYPVSVDVPEHVYSRPFTSSGR